MPTKKLTANRARLSHRVGCALRHPDRVPKYLVRAGRDAWLRLRHPDHVSYRAETLLGLAERHGLAARFMDDWERLPHGQSKIRVTHRAGAERPRTAGTPRS